MAWCPNCKIEYVNGVEICNECGSKLVEFNGEEEDIKNESKYVQSNLDAVTKNIYSSEFNKVAITIKILAIILLLFGFIFAIYTSVDYWIKLRDFGQTINNGGVPFQQFVTMFGRSLFASIITFTLGEGLQILHDIRKKLYEC